MGERVMGTSLRLAILVLATVVAGSAVAAEPDAQVFAKRVFGRDVVAKGKTYACFTHRYDAAHLRQHPQQKTTAMKLLVSAEIVPEDKEPNYSLALGVTFRDRKGHFDTMGSCGIRRRTRNPPTSSCSAAASIAMAAACRSKWPVPTNR
jgi:hypothetical protein